MLAKICLLSSGPHDGIIYLPSKARGLLDRGFVDNFAGCEKFGIFSVNIPSFIIVPQYHTFPVHKVRQVLNAGFYLFGTHIIADSEQAQEFTQAKT